MSFLTFVIPTRKRHRELAACVRSIAEQVGDTDTNIIILYNSDEEQTVRTVERLKAKYKFISTQSFEGEPDYTVKFKAMFLASPESDWVWTFGDDEVLTPGALDFMLGRLKKAPAELSFIHISERKRSTKSGDTYTGRLIDLCCEFGWLEVTGFISGNITRGAKLASCVSHNWNAYAKTAYVQSCAILEGLRKDQALLIDNPLYDTQPDVDETVKDTKAQQWLEANTVVRYLLLSDALQTMYDQEILKSKLPPKFFRYHNYHLWDRHITCFLNLWISEKSIWFDDWALYVKKMVSFIDDIDIAQHLVNEVNTAQRLVLLQRSLDENSKIIGEAIQEMHKLHNEQQYHMNIANVDIGNNSQNVTNLFRTAA